MSALVAVVLVGLTLSATMVWAQRRQLSLPSPPLPKRVPAVSILKPLRGLDAELEANLASFLRLDYPEFEVLFGVDDPADPALAVVERLVAAHPNVSCRIVVDSRRVGLNPKVNNLANLARFARHDVVWIADSNTRVAPDTLARLVAHLLQPGVGLVSSPFRGVRAAGLGGACESLQLNTFVIGGVSAVSRLWGGVCVVGKSMLLRRSTLDEFGGFAFLSQFLAEDQVCGEEVARLGGSVVVSGKAVDNVLGSQSVRAFLARHLRWAKIRRRMNPAAYAGELLLNPVFVALAGAAVLHTSASFELTAAALLASSGLDALAERSVGAPRRLVLYPLLALAKSLLIGVCWAVPFFSTCVTWRGNRLRIGPRTSLVPAAPTPAPTLDPASA